jgi:hypothetical protein
MDPARQHVETEGENTTIPTGARVGAGDDVQGTMGSTDAPRNDLESADVPNEDWGADVHEPDERRT